MSGVPISLGAKPRALTRTDCRRCGEALHDGNARRVTWRPQQSFVGLCRACERVEGLLRAKGRRR